MTRAAAPPLAGEATGTGPGHRPDAPGRPGALGALAADVAAGAGLLRELPAFLRRPVSVPAARSMLADRLHGREDTFLALARRAIFEHAASPYRPLLRRAGCEHGDLVRLVRRDGLEAALRALLDAGVCLRVDEFKGRREVRHGQDVLRVDPEQFRNPGARPHLPGQSSGSRGARTRAPLDLAFVAARAVDYALIASRLLPERAAHAVWKTPGGDVLDNLLCFAGFGAVAERWFLHLAPASPGFHPRYRWSAAALRAGGWLGGVQWPEPEVVTLDDPLPIARWMAEALRRGATPHLQLFASAGVRLCQAAQGAGLDVAGSWLMVGGEPLTPARASLMRAAGVRLLPRYGTAEAPSIAIGCTRPDADDVHLLSDLYAVVAGSPGPAGGALPADALWLSTLCPTAPLVLLNVSLGDHGTLGPAGCGCPLADLGWTTRLHSVRSFEKLTAGGMTFLDTDVIRVLEEVLPTRCGGGPADYQLVEDDDAGGRPVVRLLVHPRVRPGDLEGVGRVFLEALGAASDTARVMARLWGEARFLRVECRPPLTTASGKILHVHRPVRSGAPPPAR